MNKHKPRGDEKVAYDQEPAGDGSAAPQAGDANPGKSRPRRRGLKALLWIFGILLGIPIIVAAVMLAIALLFRSDPSAHMPEGFSAYASLPSASSFTSEVLHLKALDAALSDPANGSLRGTVRSLRANPFLRSSLFLKLADVRVDAAAYGGGFVLAADLGLRSALTRLAHPLARLFPYLIANVPGLSYEPDATPPRFRFQTEGLTLYALLYRNVLVAASSPELLELAARPARLDGERALAKALAAPGDASLRFLADTEALAKGAAGGQESAGAGNPLSALIGSLSFPSLSVVDLGLSDNRVSLNASLPWSSAEEGLSELLGKRARTPSSLSRLPESAEYFSLLSMARPDELWSVLAPFLGEGAVSAYGTADGAAKAAFGMDLPEMLFSWMGDELGVLGSSHGPAPVFFASVKDERARRDVFEKAFDSLLMGRDISVTVNGVRVPRIVFPRWMLAFLEKLGIRLAEPFYLVEDGFLWLSSSAETLASCVAESRSGKLLVKTERWKSVAQDVSPEASALVYYTLDRSVPFFLRSSGGIAQALKLYRRGMAVFRSGKDGLSLSLSAVSVAGPAAAELPGFPAKAGSRMDSDPVLARGEDGAPMAYWTSGRSVLAMDLSSGATERLELDGKAMVAAQLSGTNLVALWAVSESGTVYRTDGRLKTAPGFPILSGQAISAQPAVLDGSLVAPVSGQNALMLVDPEGSMRYSAAMNARARSAPAVLDGMAAALPRSFDAQLYLFDAQGALKPGWPVALSSLASAPPVLARTSSGILIGAITEAGEFSVWTTDGSPANGFPVTLYGTFTAAPAWAPGLRAWYLLSSEGTLWRLGLDGSVRGSVPLPRGQARDGAVAAIDSDGDGLEEIYVSGGGDALYAYSHDLAPLQGFPLPGVGLPAFLDIDGDRQLDMVTRGTDDTVHAREGGSR